MHISRILEREKAREIEGGKKKVRKEDNIPKLKRDLRFGLKLLIKCQI